MSKSPHRKGRSKRSCCLSIIGMFAALIIAAGGAFAWLYTHPISNASLHTRVLHRLERISGLDVAYDSASLTIATGKYKITNLRFIDPERPSVPVLTLGEVYATINPWQLISDPESVITHVVLKNPSRLDLVYTPDSITLGERSKFLLEAVEKAQPPGSNQKGRLPFDVLEIQNAEIGFSESEGILPGLDRTQAALLMSGKMNVTNAGSSGLKIHFSGLAAQPSGLEYQETTSSMAEGIEASILINSKNSLSAKGTVERLALNRIFRNLPQTSVQAGDLNFAVSSDTNGTDRAIKGTVKAASMAFISPEKDIRVNDENVNLTADVELETSAGLAQVRSLVIESDGAKASMSGSTKYHEPQSYDVVLSTKELDQEYRAILEKLLPSGWAIQANQQSLAFNVRAIGSKGALTSLNGAVTIRGLNLKTPELPASLTNLEGDLQFSDNSVQLANLTGAYAGAKVALDGVFHGNPLQDKTGSLELNWSAAVSLEEAFKLHGKQIATAGMALSGSGNIRGNGTWRQDVSLQNPGASSIPNFAGNIEFENVAIQHSSLPAPVAGLSGKTRIVDNRLEVENLSGKMQGNELTVDGFLEGQTYFWRDSIVSATLKSKLDLEHLGPYLSSEQNAGLLKYELAGLANTEMLMDGPINDLGSKLTGVVHLTNVSLTPGLEFMQGKFSEVAGIVAWNGRTLYLDKLSGRLNGEAIQLSGEISSQMVDLQIKSQTSLEAVQKTFPQFDKFLEMSGGLDTNLSFVVGNDTQPVASSISEVVESARVMVDAAVKDKTFALNGALRLDDASIRHIAMPIARQENGTKIPAGRVTGMTGTVELKNDTLSVPDNKPLTCAFSDTPQTRLSGFIKLRPENFPAMKVKISSAGVMNLDTWASGWGKAIPDLSSPPITGKKFDLEADILASSVSFRGQKAGPSQAKIVFKMVQDKTPRITDFQNVVIEGNSPGLGRIAGGGRIESFVWNKQQFPKWQTSLDVQSMPLESMLTAVFREQPRLQGMITGKVELQGIGNNAHTISGRGSGFMTNLEIGGTAVIRELGQTTGRNLGGKLFQTAQAATFEVGNGALSSRDLALETNGLKLEMRADYWFAGNTARGIAPKTIDGTLRLRLFKSVFGSIPIIGAFADLADEVANAFLLAFRITGTADNPRITPVPLPLFQGGV